MFDISEVHFRVFYILVAISVLSLLRKPLRNPEKPGSLWFAIAVGSVSVWLVSVGLYYFVDVLWAGLILYNNVLFAITVFFFSWLLIAIEFATRKRPPRSVLVILGVLALGHLLVLWTNYVWLHELVYRASGTFVDDGGGLNTGREPVFWIQMAVVYVIVFGSSAVFIAEWLNSDGPRKRQAGILAVTPAVGVVTSVLWFAEVLRLPFDPTPIGVTVGIVLLGWGLYRTEFLEITPVAMRTVVEEMPDAVVVLDDKDRVVEWNRAARALFPVTEPSVGMAASTFFESVSPEALPQLIGSDRSNSQVSFEIDERTRRFSVSKFAIETGQTPIGRVVVLRDISELKRREDQLLAQNERLNEFTDIVSHDLQGPLMEIRSNAQAVTATGDVRRADRVLAATDRIDELVTDLLTLARTGRQVDVEEFVDVDEIARTAWSHVWSPSGELVVETDRTAIGDPNRIQQLFENVFRNAVEHGSTSPRSRTRQDDTDHGRSADRSTASVGTDRSEPSADGPTSHNRAAGLTAVEETPTSESSPDGSATDDPTDVSSDSPLRSDRRGEDGGRETGESAVGVRVTVGPLPDGFYIEDDGPGIPPEQRNRVFEKGYTSSASGTGIGLSIVRQIVDAHGWSIRLTDGTHGGARFEITGVESSPSDSTHDRSVRSN